MIKFRITLDQARIIEQVWLPFMVMSADSTLRSNAGIDSKYLNSKIIVSLLQDVKVKFAKRMIEPTKKLNFKLSPAHASAFYVYLMKLPIDVDLVWANNFRQQLCDLLHQQLFFDRHVDIESVPVTLADYEFGE